MKSLVVLGFALLLAPEIAAAQTVTVTPQHQAEARAQGARLLLDRGTGQGRIEVECAAGDTTRACVEAVLPIIGVLSPGEGSGTGVAYATTSIKCGDTIYEVSTGTNGGNCSTGGTEGGQNTSAGCNDGKNEANANCQKGCGATYGSGSCTIKSAN